MTIDPLSFCIGLVAGQLAIAPVIYLTAVCVRRLVIGRSIEPTIPRRPAPADEEGGYTSPYNRSEP